MRRGGGAQSHPRIHTNTLKGLAQGATCHRTPGGLDFAWPECGGGATREKKNEWVCVC